MSNKISRRGFLGLVAAGAVASVGVLAACGKTNSTNEAANTSEAAGDTQRVVALNTGQLDNLLMLGIVPVGVAAAKGAELIPQFIKDKFGSQYDLDSIANCGLRQTPNVEAISKLEPTLICANERTDEEILTKLRDIAPVVTGKGGGENWKDDLATIAEAVGKKDEAKKLLDAYLADAADFKGKLPAEVPTVSFLRTKDDAFQVYGTNSMAGTVAADCGLAPIHRQSRQGPLRRGPGPGRCRLDFLRGPIRGTLTGGHAALAQPQSGHRQPCGRSRLRILVFERLPAVRPNHIGGPGQSPVIIG